MTIDIHSQTGTIEEPLSTLGEMLAEPSKENLLETAKKSYARAPLAKRAGWWFDAHAGQTLLGAFIIGLAAGASVLYAATRE